MKNQIKLLLVFSLILSFIVPTQIYADESNLDMFNDFVENGRTYNINGEDIIIRILENITEDDLEKMKKEILDYGFTKIDENIINFHKNLEESFDVGGETIVEYNAQNSILRAPNSYARGTYDFFVSLSIPHKNGRWPVDIEGEITAETWIDSSNSISSVTPGFRVTYISERDATLGRVQTSTNILSKDSVYVWVTVPIKISLPAWGIDYSSNLTRSHTFKYVGNTLK